MDSLDGKTAAALLHVSTRRLYQIANEDNPPPKAPDGKYPTCEFGDWLRARHANDLGVQQDGNVLDLQAERARLAKEQADKTAMENARQRGELVPVAAVRGLLEKILSAFRTRILSLPTRIATQVIGIKATAEARDLIEEHLQEALNDLSRINVSSLGSRSGAANGKAAAKANGKSVGRRTSKAKS